MQKVEVSTTCIRRWAHWHDLKRARASFGMIPVSEEEHRTYVLLCGQAPKQTGSAAQSLRRTGAYLGMLRYCRGSRIERVRAVARVKMSCGRAGCNAGKSRTRAIARKRTIFRASGYRVHVGLVPLRVLYSDAAAASLIVED